MVKFQQSQRIKETAVPEGPCSSRTRSKVKANAKKPGILHSVSKVEKKAPRTGRKTPGHKTQPDKGPAKPRISLNLGLEPREDPGAALSSASSIGAKSAAETVETPTPASDGSHHTQTRSNANPNTTPPSPPSVSEAAEAGINPARSCGKKVRGRKSQPNKAPANPKSVSKVRRKQAGPGHKEKQDRKMGAKPRTKRIKKHNLGTVKALLLEMESENEKAQENVRIMALIYKDIHVASLAIPIQSTSDLAAILAQKPKDFGTWIQSNISLETQAVLSVIEYAILWRHIVASKNGKLSDTIFDAVNNLSNETDRLGRGLCIANDEERLSKRYAQFAEEVGWMLLSILANSPAFREAARSQDVGAWIALEQMLSANKNSIEVFAKVRGLNWTAALEQPSKFRRHMDFQEEYQEIVASQPHSYIVPSPGEPLKWPQTQEGDDQINILVNQYNQEDWKPHTRPDNWPTDKEYPSDPTLRQGDNACDNCVDSSCDCEPQTSHKVIRPLVELRVYENKGNGIRALEAIRKDQLLDEYTGELVHLDTFTDRIYGFKFETHAIQARLSGNWTRYINHSCDPSTKYIDKVFGKRERLMIKAVKDIAMFDELTVDYGPSYWAGSTVACRCGASGCKYRTEEQRRKKGEEPDSAKSQKTSRRV